tara:strand:+ start:917 stop:1564 length:648 start_codon:yes stop_codon:yes gene_type:complete
MKITIPTSLKDINLRQYKKFLGISDNLKENDKFVKAKLIEIFCNIPLEQVMRLKLKDSEEITESIYNMFDEKPELVKNFKLDGVEYGFHPKLDDMSLGEYIDLDTFIGDWDNIEKAMAVLYRPIVSKFKKQYNISEYEVGKEKNILDMPMDAVMSSLFFLWNLGLELSTIMTNSLDKGQTQALTQYLNSQANGVGINRFTGSLTAILQDLKVSLN